MQAIPAESIQHKRSLDAPPKGSSERLANGYRIRMTVLLLAAIVPQSACRDLGLDGNVPLNEAENRRYRYSTYESSEAVGEPGRTLPFNGRNWMASADVEPIPEGILREVGSASGTTLYAPVWEEPPFPHLYSFARPGLYHPVKPVP